MTSPRENTFYSFKTEKEINHFNMRPPHIHDFYELLIVLDGEIHQLIEKTDFVFHSGSCCLMNHNIVHKEIFFFRCNSFVYRNVKRASPTAFRR